MGELMDTVRFQYIFIVVITDCTKPFFCKRFSSMVYHFASDLIRVGKT